MRHLLAAPLAAALCATVLAACGGDSATSDSPEPAADSAAKSAPTSAAVLTCLKSAGLDAEDQSSNTSGETIGIDSAGGRTVIAFEESADDADSSEIAAKGAGGEVLRVGTIVVSFADEAAATASRSDIEGCIG